MSSTEEMKKAISKEALDGYVHQLADAAIKQLRLMKTNRRVEFTYMCNVVPQQNFKIYTLVGPVDETTQQWVKRLDSVLSVIKPPASVKDKFQFMFIVSVPPSSAN